MTQEQVKETEAKLAQAKAELIELSEDKVKTGRLLDEIFVNMSVIIGVLTMQKLEEEINKEGK